MYLVAGGDFEGRGGTRDPGRAGGAIEVDALLAAEGLDANDPGGEVERGGGCFAGRGEGDREVLGAHAQRGMVEGPPSREDERAAGEGAVAVPGEGELVDGRGAEEGRDEEVAGLVVDVAGCAHLLQPPTLHYRNALSQRQGLGLVVSDEDHGRAEAVVERGNLVAGPQPQPGVQVGERLVEEEDAGIAHHGAAQRDALLLSPGQLAGTAREEVRQSEHVGRSPHPLLDLLPARTAHLQPESQVPGDGHVRVEGVALEDHRHVALARGEIVHGPPPDPHLPRRRLLQPGDQAQQGALSAPRRAHEHHEFAWTDLEVHRGHRGHVSEALLHAPQDDGLGHGRHGSMSSQST